MKTAHLFSKHVLSVNNGAIVTVVTALNKLWENYR